MNPFISGWLCGWGAIVLAGVIAGLVLRLNRQADDRRLQLRVSPVERKAKKAHDDLVNACTRWIDERERGK